MNNKFKQYTEKLLIEDASDYTTEVNANVYIILPPGQEQKYDYDTQTKAIVSFGMNVEVKSWGIQNISLVARSVETLHIDLRDLETGQVVDTIDINIDPEQLKVETDPPKNYIGFGDLDIVADPRGNVDYSQSIIKAFGL